MKGAFVSTSPQQRCFLFGRILAPWQQIKTQCEVHKGFSFGEKEEQKSPHSEEKKSHIAIFR